MATTNKNNNTTFTRKQGRISKTWNGAFDILDTTMNTTHAVVTHGGSAISSSARLVDTAISGLSEVGTITMNSLREEVVTDAVLDAIQSKAEIQATLTSNGMSQKDFEAIKLSLLKGTLS